MRIKFYTFCQKTENWSHKVRKIFMSKIFSNSKQWVLLKMFPESPEIFGPRFKYFHENIFLKKNSRRRSSGQVQGNFDALNEKYFNADKKARNIRFFEFAFTQYILLDTKNEVLASSANFFHQISEMFSFIVEEY